MKILITGGNGQIAHELIQLAQKNKHEYYAPSHHELDITHQQTVENVLEKLRPDCVINTAAYTLVDQAEKNPAIAHAVNCHGAKNLAAACSKIDCFLIHLSTDYVFDGRKISSYLEIDQPMPLNVYGLTKLQGEAEVQKYCEKHIILRTSAVFGVHGNNFVKSIAKLARSKDELSVVADQVTAPTAAVDIAETIMKILAKRPSDYGVFHYCSRGEVSWYEFAKMIIAHVPDARLQIKSLHPIHAADYGALAKRPAYSVLRCDKINGAYGISQPDWRMELAEVIKHA